MARSFDVPQFYRSEIIGKIKLVRNSRDPRKRDLSPTLLFFGPLEITLARHFGFCYGVENAIEIAYKAIEEHPDKRIFLLSEIIHNPEVNSDLRNRGVQFIMSTSGERLISSKELKPEDIVIVPAFGTTLETQEELQKIGIDPYRYDTTCPFVKRVWKRAEELVKDGFSIIIHGKRAHEETRATFSHSVSHGPALVVRGIEDARFVADFINKRIALESFLSRFSGAMSEGFDALKDLRRVGVINQTTMLASETEEISEIIKQALITAYGLEHISQHFADTKDTLCYATNENQSATLAMINQGADLALVVGGYNSSNTSHLVELCSKNMPTFYIKDASEILSKQAICCYDLQSRSAGLVSNWLPSLPPDRPLRIALTSGASCPDRTVDEVLTRVVGLFEDTLPISYVLKDFISNRSPADCPKFDNSKESSSNTIA